MVEILRCSVYTELSGWYHTSGPGLTVEILEQGVKKDGCFVLAPNGPMIIAKNHVVECVRLIFNVSSVKDYGLESISKEQHCALRWTDANGPCKLQITFATPHAASEFTNQLRDKISGKCPLFSISELSDDQILNRIKELESDPNFSSLVKRIDKLMK